MKWSNPRPYGISLTAGVKGPHCRDGTWPASAEHQGVLTDESVERERIERYRRATTTDVVRREEVLADLRDGDKLLSWWVYKFCRCRGGHNGHRPPKTCAGWILRDGMIRR